MKVPTTAFRDDESRTAYQNGWLEKVRRRKLFAGSSELELKYGDYKDEMASQNTPPNIGVNAHVRFRSQNVYFP